MDTLKKLQGKLRRLHSVVVAYSGGVDSTLLLKVAHDILKDKVLAVTAVSPTYTSRELWSAKKMAAALGIRHKVIKTKELFDRRFASNPLKRCYFCKRELFRSLQAIAKKYGLAYVADASTVSDRKDFRKVRVDGPFILPPRRL